MKLKQEYGLDTFTMSDLVEEALKFSEEHKEPIVVEKQMDDAAPIQESMHEESQRASAMGGEMGG
jgi:hypothetical protein